jgi:hypothetical protein
MKVQSVLIPRKLYSLTKAKTWISKHNYKLKKVDTTEDYYRFRQYTPKDKDTYRTIGLGKEGIKAVININQKS